MLMNTFPIILSVIIAFAATLSAGIFAKKLKNRIGIVCAFSAGFFIALSLFEFLPDILVLLPTAQINLDRVFLTAVIGFVSLFAINRSFSRLHVKKHTMAQNTFQPRIGLLSSLEFCSHSFLEGIAIGVSFQLQFGLGIFIAMAVISHDICDGISTLAIMLDSGNSLRSSMRLLLIDAVAPALGAISTLFFGIPNFILVYVLSFLLGSFLYIGSGILLPDAYRMNRPITTLAFFMTGFFLILILARIIS
jgi:zinc transporter ZupT